MRNHKQCPDCSSFETERVHTEWETDLLEEIRICNSEDCNSQFTNKWDLFEQSIDEVPA